MFIAILGPSMQPPLAALLYFDAEKMVIHLPEQDNTTYDLQPDAVVEAVVYFAASLYKSSQPSILEWKGFGEY